MSKAAASGRGEKVRRTVEWDREPPGGTDPPTDDPNSGVNQPRQNENPQQRKEGDYRVALTLTSRLT